jgi:hypothetical protein
MSAPSLSPKPRGAPSDARGTPRIGFVLCAWLVLCAVTAAAPMTSAAAAASTTPMVNLGSASTYAVLSGASVGNTVSAPGTPHTTLHGSLGVKANTQPTGFPPGIVTGSVEVATPAALAAHAAVVAAYDEVAARTGGDTIAGALAGSTIGPGLHSIAGAVSNTSTVTLDAGGDASAVFVFQVNGAMAMAAGSHVVLTGGARAARVFWQVNGAGAIGAGASFAGTLMALDAVAVGNGSVVNGRAFARNGALTLDDDEIYSAPPAVAIDGGATASTTDTTPTISGTTDIQAPALVTVTINGQTLTATPASGAWSITSTAMLGNATYSVVATVVDGAGNESSATQSLTVDTDPPVVELAGGASLTTSDTTPTVAGTSDVAPGTIVHVTFGSLALTALVQPGGAWNITPPAVLDGTYAVTASVADPAGNASTAHQSIQVDTVPPGLTLAGGASALTRDATPEITGTAAVAAGTSVTVSLADETLTAVTLANGSFSVTAARLADGPHRVVTAVSDAAGNSATFTQILTVDTVAPAIAITGGATASTTAQAPTITGTSDAAPGTTITVEIAGQTMTTILQANGTWNATPPALGEGAWAVSASAQDPAGNEGVADQTLTILPIAPAAPAAVPPAVPAGEPILVPAPAFLAPPPANLAIPAVAAASAVAGSSSQKVGARSLWVLTRVTAPSGGGVLATAEGTVRIRGARKAIVLSRAGAVVSAGRTATMKIALEGGTARARADLRRIKAAIAKGTRVTATITVSVADAAGATRTIVRTVKLTA